MDNVHWDKYYTKNSNPFSPSDFALSMIKNLKVNSTLIDIGCGNGDLLEYYPPEVDELRKELFYPKLILDSDGYVTVPDTPGIGFDLNMDLLNRYRVS